MAVVKDIYPFSTRVNASISFLDGVPRWIVRVTSVVPSAVDKNEFHIFLQKINLGIRT